MIFSNISKTPKLSQKFKESNRVLKIYKTKNYPKAPNSKNHIWRPQMEKIRKPTIVKIENINNDIFKNSKNSQIIPKTPK